MKQRVHLPKIEEKVFRAGEVCSRPLRETVFETIRQAIIDGVLPPGERLMEVQLAEDLGVSRTPVREAIRKLELEGLVHMLPRKGARVAPLSPGDVRDMMQIRGALEALAARLAAKNAGMIQIGALKHNNYLFEKAAREGNIAGIVSSDIAFHETLYEASGNSRLRTMINALREQMQRVRILYISSMKDTSALVGQHASVIAAIEAHDPERAWEESQKHITETNADMEQVLAGVRA